jgi:hypothetical protein
LSDGESHILEVPLRLDFLDEGDLESATESIFIGSIRKTEEEFEARKPTDCAVNTVAFPN